MQKPSKQVSPVLEEHFRFLLWLIPTLNRFPKSQKFLLGDRIQGLAQEVLEALIEANYSRERTQHLRRANLGIDKLRFLLRMATDFKFLDRAATSTLPLVLCAVRPPRRHPDGGRDPRQLATGGASDRMQLATAPWSGSMKSPCVYILASKPNGTLYVGVTSDLFVRVGEHKQELIEGFTKRYGVHRLVYYEMHETMDDAIRREKQLKEWKRAWKIRLIESMNPEWIDLFDKRTGTILDGPADLARRTR